ncbi:MAG: hypothetical protein ACK4TP_01420 [Hyphomicrobium sp.]|jgi:hypothetical protein
MTIRLALAAFALAAAGVAFVGGARATSAPLLGDAAARSKAASHIVQVARKRRSRDVGTRATAPETSALPAGKASNGEVLFGVQDVGFLVDRDVIRVGAEIGKFDRIRLRVLRNEIFVTDLKAVFDDGTTETLLTDAKIGADRKTDWIPLNHKGFIKEIQLVYRSKPDFKGQARVEVFGEYEPGWLGPNGEGRKYNDGWVLLGTDTAGSVGFDRVKIPVGQNEGGFKQLRVSVKDRDITMTNLAVVYSDGAKDEIETNRIKVEADKAFGPVDIKKGATIKEIEATWRSRALATSKRDRAYATVQVWGKH